MRISSASGLTIFGVREIAVAALGRATTISPETLRAQCEVRDATYLTSDLRG
jgi:hypothetical protein